MKPRILIAESEAMFAEAVAYVLEQAGYEAVAAHNSRLALDKASEFHPDLVILNAALPAVWGSRLCCDIRDSDAGGKRTPILMMGTDPSEDSRVALLEWGADDYLLKPFGMREFMARIHSLVRRAKSKVEDLQTQEIHLGQFWLVPFRSILSIDNGTTSRMVPVTPRECGILHALMSCEGNIVTRETLLELVWGKAKKPAIAKNTLDVHLGHLRRKIEMDADNPRHILSVRGVGFRFQP